MLLSMKMETSYSPLVYGPEPIWPTITVYMLSDKHAYFSDVHKATELLINITGYVFSFLIRPTVFF